MKRLFESDMYLFSLGWVLHDLASVGLPHTLLRSFLIEVRNYSEFFANVCRCNGLGNMVQENFCFTTCFRTREFHEL